MSKKVKFGRQVRRASTAFYVGTNDGRKNLRDRTNTQRVDSGNLSINTRSHLVHVRWRTGTTQTYRV